MNRTMPPTQADFQKVLNDIFRESEERGDSFVDVKAGDLHSRVGGYPGPNNRMPVCCTVMYNNMQDGDTVLSKPRGGKGASLVIRYSLPRSKRERDQNDNPARDKGILKNITKENTLIVISCTYSKVWARSHQTPCYVPAQEAYTGSTFQWLEKNKQKVKNFPWIILSAKYGFIEPEHPIHNYDVTFNQPKTGPISVESLKNQVLYQRRLFGEKERKLCHFKYVLVKGGDKYLDRCLKAFPSTVVVRELTDELWSTIVTKLDP